MMLVEDLRWHPEVMRRVGRSYIKIIEFWDAVFSDELRYRRIPLAEPAEKLWNTHDRSGKIALLSE